MSTHTKEPLQDQLDRITQNTRALVQPERLAISEKATEDLFNTGIEDRVLKDRIAGSRLHPRRRPHAQTRQLRRPRRPGPARHQLLSRSLGPLLRHGTRSLARTPLTTPRTRRSLRGHLPPDHPPEQLHPPAARPPLPSALRPRCHHRRKIRHRLHHPRGASPLLPIHPHQHSLQQRRPQLPQRHRSKLAPPPPRRLRHRPHQHHSLRRSPRRLPCPPRTCRHPRSSSTS